VNPLHPLVAGQPKLWNDLKRIAEERGRELSLPADKLMSSIVRVAVEQFVERHRAAKPGKRKA
jgi:hypothetical protein